MLFTTNEVPIMTTVTKIITAKLLLLILCPILTRIVSLSMMLNIKLINCFFLLSLYSYRPPDNSKYTGFKCLFIINPQNSKARNKTGGMKKYSEVLTKIF